MDYQQAVLGSVLLDPKKIHHVKRILTIEDFTNLNKEIYESMIYFANLNYDVDILVIHNNIVNKRQGNILKNEINPDKELISYINHLTDLPILLSSLCTYIYNVKEESLKRKYLQLLIEAKEDLKKDAYTRKSHDIITDTMQGLMKLNYDIDDIKTIKEATSDFIDYLEQPETDLLSAGFNELDKVIPGVPRHSLMVLGADSGVGKTVFSINQAINKCLKGEKVLFISLEIKIIDLVEIIIPYLSKNKITYADVLNAKNNPEKIALIKEIILEELNELGLFFATNCYSIDQVISAIDYHRINYDIDCVFLDHAQLISGSEEYNQYVSLTKTLMQYKNKNNISIQLLSQFNDKKDNRADKEPRKTDLRAGGNLYQDADIVLFLYKLEDSENKVYLKLAKNRKGANNKVLYFDLDFDGKSRRIFLNPCDKPVKEEPAIPRKPFWEKKKKGMNDDD